MPLGSARVGMLGSGVAIPDSAVNQWRFDEGSGNTINDAIGSIAGARSGATWVLTNDGVGGYWLDLDNTDDYVDFDSVSTPLSDAVSGSQEFTMAVTIDQADTPQREMLWSFTGGGGNSLMFWDGTLNAGFNGLGAEYSFETGPTDLTRVVLTWDTSSLNGYLNTTQTGRSGSATASQTDGGDMAIGIRQDDLSSYPFNGAIDNPIVYDKVLTTEEIQDDYDAQPWS